MTISNAPVSADFIPQPKRMSFRKMAADTAHRVSEFLIALDDWRWRARERRQLLGLSDMALKDFGASRADAEAEGSRPFWRA